MCGIRCVVVMPTTATGGDGEAPSSLSSLKLLCGSGTAQNTKVLSKSCTSSSTTTTTTTTTTSPSSSSSSPDPVIGEEEKIPDWLTRRGPDEQRSIVIPIFRGSGRHVATNQSTIAKNANIHDENNKNNNNKNDDKNNNNKSYSGCYCILQASVLCLRPLHISQPVDLFPTTTTTKPVTNSHSHPRRRQCQQHRRRISCHFCWNGEIYQVLRPEEEQEASNCNKNNKNHQHEEEEDDEEVEQKTGQEKEGNTKLPLMSTLSALYSSDTQWMAQQIQQILSSEEEEDDNDEKDKQDSHVDSKLSSCHSEQVATILPSLSDKKEKNKNGTIVQKRLEALGHLLSRLNAEFAFCLVIVNDDDRTTREGQDDDDGVTDNVVDKDNDGSHHRHYHHRHCGDGVYFSRDAFGRRSLVVREERTASTMTRQGPLLLSHGRGDGNGCWELASVATTETVQEEGSDGVGMWTEVLPSTIGYYNWHTGQTIFHDWTTVQVHSSSIDLASTSSSLPIPPLPSQTIVDCSSSSTGATHLTNTFNSPPQEHVQQEQVQQQQVQQQQVQQQQEQRHLYYRNTLYRLLRDAVERRLRINNDPTISSTTALFHSKCTILFSGGLDSTVLAYLALEVTANTANRNTPIVQLVNVSFIDDDDNNNNNHHEQLNAHNNHDDNDVVDDDKTCPKQKQPTTSSVEAADTKTAYESYKDLQRLFPNRNIPFVHRKVTWSEIRALQQHRIPQLLHPKDTSIHNDKKKNNNNKKNQKEECEATPIADTTRTTTTKASSSSSAMDVNVATALWFAADTAARTTTRTTTTAMTATAGDEESEKNRILLTGLGADEFMGGYGRHRKAYQEGGIRRLLEELELDQGRLWQRNCGRDDRVLSDTNQEVRYPFLDVHVTQFLSSVCCCCSSSSLSLSSSSLSSSVLVHPIVCDFDLPPGYGDKKLLRDLAHVLGLSTASVALKRAIQFGSRISHVVDKQRFGSRRKAKPYPQKTKKKHYNNHPE